MVTGYYYSMVALYVTGYLQGDPMKTTNNLTLPNSD